MTRGAAGRRSTARVKVDFSELSPLRGLWERPLMRALIEIIVRAEASEGHFAVGLHLLDDAGLRELNGSRRGVDAATDVLSFPLHDPSGLRFVLPPDEPIHLGDVAVSYERAQSQASELGHSPRRELGYLVAHGMLHLLGFDHEQPEEQRAMREKEEAALAELGLSR